MLSSINLLGVLVCSLIWHIWDNSTSYYYFFISSLHVSPFYCFFTQLTFIHLMMNEPIYHYINGETVYILIFIIRLQKVINDVIHLRYIVSRKINSYLCRSLINSRGPWMRKCLSIQKVFTSNVNEFPGCCLIDNVHEYFKSMNMR